MHELHAILLGVLDMTRSEQRGGGSFGNESILFLSAQRDCFIPPGGWILENCYFEVKPAFD